MLFLKRHYEGGFIYREQILIEAIPDPQALGGWRIKYGFQDTNPGKPGVEAETKALDGDGDGPGVAFSIPIEQKARPGLKGTLRIEEDSPHPGAFTGEVQHDLNDLAANQGTGFPIRCGSSPYWHCCSQLRRESGCRLVTICHMEDAGMLKQESSEGRAVALYWDFENIHAGLCEEKEPGAYARPDFRFKPQEPLVNVQAVVDMAASFGPIAINRAYCNWQFFGRYRDQMLQNAVELIQLFPPGGAAKNGADIKLCLDATEDIGRFPHIGTVIVVGGDSDFMPVSQKIKAAGRILVGVGTRRATNRHWAKSCHEFRFYETLIEVLEGAAAADDPPASAAPGAITRDEATQPPTEAQQPVEEDGAAKPKDLLRRALRLLADKKGEPWVNKAEIGPMVKRLDPTFDLAEHGYETFSGMLKALDAIVEVRKGEFDQQVRLR